VTHLQQIVRGIFTSTPPVGPKFWFAAHPGFEGSMGQRGGKDIAILFARHR